MRQQQPPKKTKKNSSPPLSLRANRKEAAQPTLRSRALRLLGRRELSRQELDKKLRPYASGASDAPDTFDAPEAAGVAPVASPADLAALLDDLTERGWLSDARYAEALVRKRTGNFARRSIAQELKRAGVDEEVTAAALTQNPESDPDAEFAAALALCQRKFRRAPTDQKEKARQLRFLQSRGYSIGLALRVLKHAAQSDHDAE